MLRTKSLQDTLYKILTDKKATPSAGGEIRRNFTKFLTDRNGRVFASGRHREISPACQPTPAESCSTSVPWEVARAAQSVRPFLYLQHAAFERLETQVDAH
jgi:hypothetical protein